MSHSIQAAHLSFSFGQLLVACPDVKGAGLPHTRSHSCWRHKLADQLLKPQGTQFHNLLQHLYAQDVKGPQSSRWATRQVLHCLLVCQVPFARTLLSQRLRNAS